MVHPAIASLGRGIDGIQRINERLRAKKIVDDDPDLIMDIANAYPEDEGDDDLVADIGSVQQADGGPYTLTWTLESCIDESDERPDGPDSLHPTVTVELRQDQGGGKHELIAYVYYWPVSDTWYARGPSGDEQPVAPKERQTVYERQSSNTDQAGALAVVDTMANLVLTAKGKATN